MHLFLRQDKFADFMTKMLRSTAHAFENVSLASTQAFATVNEALEMIQKVPGHRTAQEDLSTLPRPVVKHRKSKLQT